MITDSLSLRSNLFRKIQTDQCWGKMVHFLVVIIIMLHIKLCNRKMFTIMEKHSCLSQSLHLVSSCIWHYLCTTHMPLHLSWKVVSWSQRPLGCLQLPHSSEAVLIARLKCSANCLVLLSASSFTLDIWRSCPQPVKAYALLIISLKAVGRLRL